MRRHVKTGAGTQRWFCPLCAKTGIKKRLDQHQRGIALLFQEWLTGNATLKDLAKRFGVSKQTLVGRFKKCWHQPCAATSQHNVRTIVLDATGIEHDCVLLIILDAQTNAPIAWRPAMRETYASWTSLLERCPQQPRYVVADGHAGLLKAVRERWPKILIQRCIAHVLREMRVLLTRRPKLPAGIALRILVAAIPDIHTRRQKRKWVRALLHWQKKYKQFLKEKTFTLGGHWHYTHRRLRHAATHLLRALPDLFRFVTDRSVPNTSNQVEGGLNASIKDLLRKHRGMSVRRRLVVATFYLRKRAEKTTRNFN